MYQIKCVHCFKSIEEKSVLFQLDDIMSVLDEVDSDSVNTDNSTIIDDIESESTSKKTKISGGMGGKRRRNSNSGSQKQTVPFEQTGDYLCLRPYFENGSVEVKDALLWNVYSIEIGNKKYSGVIDLKSVTRFCPFCKNRIIKDAGVCKIINIGMIGHQSAGKTVYLTIQDYVLFNSSSDIFPVRIFLYQTAVIADLCRKGVEHSFRLHRNPCISSYSFSLLYARNSRLDSGDFSHNIKPPRYYTSLYPQDMSTEYQKKVYRKQACIFV